MNTQVLRGRVAAFGELQPELGKSVFDASPSLRYEKFSSTSTLYEKI